MKSKLILTMIIGLIATFAVAQADAADRFFQVQVKLVAAGTSPFWKVEEGIFPPDPPGPNCYSFLDDGPPMTWIDPLFFNPFGTWNVEDSNGAVTRYTAEAIAGPFVLVQNGMWSPASSKGQVRLKAFSTAYLFGEIVAKFVSTGYEVDACPPL